MGNHQAGRAMVNTAEALSRVRDKSGQSAMEILDAACTAYKGYDAEFDDSCSPGEVFRDLIEEAFGPFEFSKKPEDFKDQQSYLDAKDDAWWEQVYEPFRDRYELC